MLIFKSDFLISDVLNLFNHLIRIHYFKNCSMIEFLKISDKISEKHKTIIFFKTLFHIKAKNKEILCLALFFYVNIN